MLFSAMTVMTALPFLLSPIRAHVLGAAGRGYFAFFQSAISLVSAIACGATMLAFYGRRIDPSRAGRLPLWRTGIGSLAVATPIACIFATIADFKFGSTVGIFILCSVFFAPLWVVGQYQLAKFQVQRQRLMIGAVVGGPAMVEFCGTATLWISARLNIVTAMVTTYCAEAFRVLVTLVSRRRSQAAGRLAGVGVVTLDEERLYRRQVVTLSPVALAPILMNNADMIVFGSLVSARELGLYAVARLGAVILLPAVMTLQGTLVAAVDGNHVGKTIIKVTVLSSLGGATLGAIGYILIPRFYGPEFVSVNSAFLICIIAGVIRVIHTSVSITSVRAGRNAAASMGSLITVGIMSIGAALAALFGLHALVAMCLVLVISPLPTTIWLLMTSRPRVVLS